MEENVLIGALAAFGLLSAVWAAGGWLLPGGRDGMAVCFCLPGLKQLSTVRRWHWLREVGLLRCPVILVDCGLSEKEKKELARWCNETELCSQEALCERLELERNRFDGTGNGNHSGRGKRRGVSEL